MWYTVLDNQRRVRMVEQWRKRLVTSVGAKRDDPGRIAALERYAERKREEKRVLMVLDKAAKDAREERLLSPNELVRVQPPAKHGRVVRDDGDWVIVKMTNGGLKRWPRAHCKRLSSDKASKASRKMGKITVKPVERIWGDGDI